jgi:hypothetical protein
MSYEAMSYEERRTWVYLATSGVAYAVYLAIVLARLVHTPVARVSYVPALLWTCLASMVAAMVAMTVFETVAPSDARRGDMRDREINRYGEYASRWCVIGGAVGGLLLAIVRWDYFWIVNVIYLGFVLWAVVGSALKLVAYRRGI